MQVIRDEMIDPNRTVQIAQVAQNEVGILDSFEMNQLLYTTPNKQFEFDDHYLEEYPSDPPRLRSNG